MFVIVLHSICELLQAYLSEKRCRL